MMTDCCGTPAVRAVVAVSELWTRLHCSRCPYMREHPGPVTVADLDGECALCRAPLGAVTVYRLSAVQRTLAHGDKSVLPHAGFVRIE
jgi:hypothetical protein